MAHIRAEATVVLPTFGFLSEGHNDPVYVPEDGVVPATSDAGEYPDRLLPTTQQTIAQMKNTINLQTVTFAGNIPIQYKLVAVGPESYWTQKNADAQAARARNALVGMGEKTSFIRALVLETVSIHNFKNSLFNMGIDVAKLRIHTEGRDAAADNAEADRILAEIDEYLALLGEELDRLRQAILDGEIRPVADRSRGLVTPPDQLTVWIEKQLQRLEDLKTELQVRPESLAALENAAEAPAYRPLYHELSLKQKAVLWNNCLDKNYYAFFYFARSQFQIHYTWHNNEAFQRYAKAFFAMLANSAWTNMIARTEQKRLNALFNNIHLRNVPIPELKTKRYHNDIDAFNRAYNSKLPTGPTKFQDPKYVVDSIKHLYVKPGSRRKTTDRDENRQVTEDGIDQEGNGFAFADEEEEVEEEG